MGQYYFLMCALPPLPDQLGEELPQPFAQLSQVVQRHIEIDDEPLLHALLMEVDATNWEQFDQGHDQFFLAGGTLTQEAMHNRRSLPFFIQRFNQEKERGLNRPCVYDRLWELYYLTALGAAQSSTNRFMLDYLSWEIDLRASLGVFRARHGGVNPDERIILDNFRSRDFTNLLNQLNQQSNPLEIERLLTRERIQHINQYEGASPFSTDALLAYTARAMLLSRFEKINSPVELQAYLGHGGKL